jgi:hypothetical protein
MSFNPLNAIVAFRCQNFMHPQRLQNVAFIFIVVFKMPFDAKTRHGGKRVKTRRLALGVPIFIAPSKRAF